MICHRAEEDGLVAALLNPRCRPPKASPGLVWWTEGRPGGDVGGQEMAEAGAPLISAAVASQASALRERDGDLRAILGEAFSDSLPMPWWNR